VNGKDVRPDPTDMVVCMDVLPFVEADKLEAVLDDLVRVTERILFMTIPTIKSAVFADDGTPADQTIEDMDWWVPRILDRFDVYSMARTPNGFWVVAKKKD
jgi:hypothetical protein